MNFKEYFQGIQTDPEYIAAEKELKLKFDLANAILRARLKKGWSQAELAEEVGTKQANISRIEAGLANPTLSLVQKLVNALELNIEFVPSEYRDEYYEEFFNSNHATAITLTRRMEELSDWSNSDCNSEYEAGDRTKAIVDNKVFAND